MASDRNRTAGELKKLAGASGKQGKKLSSRQKSNYLTASLIGDKHVEFKADEIEWRGAGSGYVVIVGSRNGVHPQDLNLNVGFFDDLEVGVKHRFSDPFPKVTLGISGDIWAIEGTLVLTSSELNHYKGTFENVVLDRDAGFREITSGSFEVFSDPA